MNPSDVAQFGSRFDVALMDAIAQQEPKVAQRLLAELSAGNYEVAVDGTPPIVTIRIGGAVVLEAHLHPESQDVKRN
jgi:hypothetical protein